jgi:hypothetical protein
MPSTQTRRYMDLITLIRETVNDAAESGWKEIRSTILELSSKEEDTAIKEFAAWFAEDVYDPDA